MTAIIMAFYLRRSVHENSDIGERLVPYVSQESINSSLLDAASWNNLVAVKYISRFADDFGSAFNETQ